MGRVYGCLWFMGPPISFGMEGNCEPLDHGHSPRVLTSLPVGHRQNGSVTAIPSFGFPIFMTKYARDESRSCILAMLRAGPLLTHMSFIGFAIWGLFRHGRCSPCSPSSREFVGWCLAQQPLPQEYCAKAPFIESWNLARANVGTQDHKESLRHTYSLEQQGQACRNACYGLRSTSERLALSVSTCNRHQCKAWHLITGGIFWWRRGGFLVGHDQSQQAGRTMLSVGKCAKRIDDSTKNFENTRACWCSH